MDNKGTSIQELISGEILSAPQQKYLAKFTKDGMCRKIKCTEDIFLTLCMPTIVNNEQKWKLKPVAFLYIRQLELISNNSRQSVQDVANDLIKILKAYLDPEKNINETEIVTSISIMVEVLFIRNRDELKFFLECISILLLFGLRLDDYFFSEFSF